MSAATARAEADEATKDAITAVNRQGESWTRASYLIMRSSALHYSDRAGAMATAEKLRQLADEIGGGA